MSPHAWPQRASRYCSQTYSLLHSGHFGPWSLAFVSLSKGLIAYYDADWASCPCTRRFTSSYFVFLGQNLLSWSSKHNGTISRCSVKVECRGVTNAVAETCWLHNLIRELLYPPLSVMLVYCENVSAVYLSLNPVQHQHTKYIEIDIHFGRDMVALGQLWVIHVPSSSQYADIFTKGMPLTLFLYFKSFLNVRLRRAILTAGGC